MGQKKYIKIYLRCLRQFLSILCSLILHSYAPTGNSLYKQDLNQSTEILHFPIIAMSNLHHRSLRLYSNYRGIRISSSKNIGPVFFVVKPLTLIDNRPIKDRTHHINLRRKNILSDPRKSIFLSPDNY